MCVLAGISSVSESSSLRVFVQAAEGPAPKVCPVPHQWAASAGKVLNQLFSVEIKPLAKMWVIYLCDLHVIYLAKQRYSFSFVFQILPTAQRLLDELLSSQSTAINTVCGAPGAVAANTGWLKKNKKIFFLCHTCSTVCSPLAKMEN